MSYFGWFAVNFDSSLALRLVDVFWRSVSSLSHEDVSLVRSCRWMLVCASSANIVLSSAASSYHFLYFGSHFFSLFSRPECSRNNYVKPLVTRSDSARTRRIDLMTRNPKKALLHLSNLEFHLYFSYLHTGCNTGLF